MERGTVLTRRLRETRRFIQVVAGPRQVGKTTQSTAAMLVSRSDARSPAHRVHEMWSTRRKNMLFELDLSFNKTYDLYNESNGELR
jgi:hypothetical protein